jgi:hypothetical protein
MTKHMGYDSPLQFTANFGNPVTVILKNNFDGGIIAADNDTIPSGSIVARKAGTNVIFKSINQDFNGINRVWNNYAPNFESIWSKFKSWNPGNTSANLTNGTTPNYTYNLDWKDTNWVFVANMRQNFHVSRIKYLPETNTTQNDGIQTNVIEQNVGSLSTPVSLTDPSGKTYNFSYWSDILTNANPRIFTPTDNTVYTAIYKGLHLSATATGFRNSSQRKFVRDAAGTLFCTYESMGNVWVEMSTDEGSTWNLLNNASSMNSNPAKHPSFAVYGTSVAIVYQQQNGSHYQIMLRVLSTTSPGIYTCSNPIVVCTEATDSYSIDANPVVAWGQGSTMVVAYEKKSTDPPTAPNGYCDAGLHYYRLIVSSTGTYTMYENGTVTGSDGNSTTPVIDLLPVINNTAQGNISWRQVNPSTGKGDIYSSAISFVQSSGLTNGYVITSTPVNVSSVDGCSDHFSPCHITADDGLARICWVGTAYQGPIWGYVTKVVFGEPDITRRWNFGSNTASPSINRTNVGAQSGTSGYAMAWSENDGSYTTKYVTYSLSNPQALSSHGYDVQLCNGPAMSAIKALTFKSKQLLIHLNFQTA